MTDGILEACRAQDAVLRALGLEIWVGAEPTFTDRSSQEPCWLTQAEGGDKEMRAARLLRAFARRVAPAAETYRAAGRQYPGESRPRFCFGGRWQRGAERAAAAVAAREHDGTSELAADTLVAAPPLPAPTAAPDLAWVTVTPDPGVVEVNLPPAPDLATFARYAEAVHAAADEAALSPLRWRYNGEETDSGGGGQLTFGGPTPERSPFVLHPMLLGRLVRYHAAHPALSYAFAPECSGSAGQGPRPDEGVRERLDELSLALERLEADPPAAPFELWAALAPLLVDASGNSHRAELNVEKLWNPYFGDRGKLGLVELRSLRMQPDAERSVAVAALFRAVIARCAIAAVASPLLDWGAGLHDRQALPALVGEDLRTVLADLSAHGVGLEPPLIEALPPPRPELARFTMGEATLSLTPALEFWPLLGDVASQERAGARLVDSSSARLQLCIDAPPGAGPGTVTAYGWTVPLAALGDGRHVGALRYRAFTPRPGLHPGLAPRDPVVFTWTCSGAALQVALHGWRPGGGAYPGLPVDRHDAERRRRERVVVAPAAPVASIRTPPPDRLTLDLRRLPASP